MMTPYERTILETLTALEPTRTQFVACDKAASYTVRRIVHGIEKAKVTKGRKFLIIKEPDGLLVQRVT